MLFFTQKGGDMTRQVKGKYLIVISMYLLCYFSQLQGMQMGKNLLAKIVSVVPFVNDSVGSNNIDINIDVVDHEVRKDDISDIEDYSPDESDYIEVESGIETSDEQESSDEYANYYYKPEAMLEVKPALQEDKNQDKKQDKRECVKKETENENPGWLGKCAIL